MDLNLVADLLENELEAFAEETEAAGMVLGRMGARIMGMLEDGEEFGEDDDDGSWVKVEVDTEGYRSMGDPSFRKHYRLRKETYEILLETLARHLVQSGRVQRVRTPLDVPLLMVLWILANPDTFRSAALRLGVLPGTVYYHYSYIIEALRELAPKYIQWPDAEERMRIKERFRAYSGFPGIVGCIDGTYNTITAPIQQRERYINRHDSFSFNTSVVCDYNLLVRDIHVGEVGSLHDQRVFRRSPLYDRLLNDYQQQYIAVDEHLIGDGAYAVTDFVFSDFSSLLPSLNLI
ncbi:Putative nuclease [Frankliniella fusca]|uniref:Nuclease n=1 Tax=Frankliniella fusca TaxID=407009 RepID=A0AAE1LTY8_9NEOP|nr:Putative nuclease [Frankliniella fusca]